METTNKEDRELFGKYDTYNLSWHIDATLKERFHMLREMFTDLLDCPLDRVLKPEQIEELRSFKDKLVDIIRQYRLATEFSQPVHHVPGQLQHCSMEPNIPEPPTIIEKDIRLKPGELRLPWRTPKNELCDPEKPIRKAYRRNAPGTPGGSEVHSRHTGGCCYPGKLEGNSEDLRETVGTDGRL